MFFTPRAIEFPPALEELLRADSTRIRPLGEAVAELWPTLSRKRGLSDGGGHYSFRPVHAEAYAAYYLPANAMKFALVLEEMRRTGLPLPADLRIADFGAGPGTTLWGAALCGLPIRYRAQEQSPEFAALGRRLASRLASIADVDAQWGHGDPVKFARGGDFNFLVFQNSVHEIFPRPEERLDAILRLTREAAKRGGTRWLVLIEPALRASSRDLLDLRKGLLAARHLRLWLPCLSHRECGALRSHDDWCHEEVAVNMPEWLNAIGAEAGLRKESVLFSYLVFSVGEHPEPERWPGDGWRMVSQRLERKGYTECHLCSPEGKIRCRVQHSKVTEENRGALEWSRGQILESLELAPSSDVVRFHCATVNFRHL
ncbi:MAG: hypothetical protein HUU37_07330 [Bdellovibrionales bacterium]|nr:hypothetical protein [Bdellovibrionales bacterium]